MIQTRLPESRGGRVLVWLIFASFIAIGFGWFGGGNQLVEAARLRASGIHAKGVITSMTAGDALNNPTAYYNFTIGGAVVHGYSHVPSAAEHRLAPGSPVTVTYLPENADKNCVDPAGLAESGKRAVLIAGVLESIFALIFIPLVVLSGQSAPARLRLRGDSLSGAVVISIMALGGIWGLFFAAIPNYRHAGDLVSQGKTAQAAITGVYDHSDGGGRYADYTFVVAGSYYHGKADYVGGYADRGPLTITYLPSDPSFSAIQPQATLSGARDAMLFMVGWLALLTLFCVAFVYGVRRDNRLTQ